MGPLRVLLVTSLALIWCASAFAQDQQLTDLRRAMQRGQEALTDKDMGNALKAFQLAAKLGEQKGIPNRIRQTVLVQAHYNSACCHALLGRKKEAILALREALTRGFDDWDHLNSDEDLASLRKEKQFLDMVAQGKANPLTTLLKERKADIEEARGDLSKGALFPFTFNRKSLDGVTSLNLKDQAGRVLIVDIWGSAFKPSQEMLPVYKDLQSRFRNAGLTVVGLAYERGRKNERMAAAIRAFKGHNLNYASALADDAIIDQIPNFAGFPTALLIDREGRVRKVLVGRREKKEIENLLLALLTEAPAAAKKAEKTKRTKKEAKKSPEEKKSAGVKDPKAVKPKAKLYEEGPF
jgi:thiol-disulfide isomerase/thioredoxin